MQVRYLTYLHSVHILRKGRDADLRGLHDKMPGEEKYKEEKCQRHRGTDPGRPDTTASEAGEKFRLFKKKAEPGKGAHRSRVAYAQPYEGDAAKRHQGRNAESGFRPERKVCGASEKQPDVRQDPRNKKEYDESFELHYLVPKIRSPASPSPGTMYASAFRWSSTAAT